MGLSAQPSLHVIRKVADAYTTLKANIRAGNLGRVGSPRRTKAESTPVRFRPTAAQPFDDRSLSWNHENKTISIWTVNGRIKNIPFRTRPSDYLILQANRAGETDLIHVDGNFYLMATINEPAPQLIKPDGWIGVDMGIVNIATSYNQSNKTSANWSGGAITRNRKRNQKLRGRLQNKNTSSAKRLLKKRGRKEARFAKDVNHQISKQIVTEAKRTKSGIAIEQLAGIRTRARLRKPQRVALNSWSFAQLAAFLTYKAEQAGIPLQTVNPAYTSQQCSQCGHTDKKNRASQANFACRSCGVLLHADHNAAINIAQRGHDSWGAVNRPNAA